MHHMTLFQRPFEKSEIAGSACQLTVRGEERLVVVVCSFRPRADRLLQVTKVIFVSIVRADVPIEVPIDFPI
jgi:hypothetical protein